MKETTIRAFAAGCLLVACNQTWAQTSDENSPPPDLPAAPAHFINFYSNSQLSAAIDPASVSVPKDGEVRYTIKITSKQGAVNISYEGILCDARLRTIYAIGQSDGSWSRTRTPEWRQIYNKGLNLYHLSLANDVVCDGKLVAGKEKDIINKLEKISVFN